MSILWGVSRWRLIKKSLEKLAEDLETLASNVMNAYFREQTDALIEFLDYIKRHL